MQPVPWWLVVLFERITQPALKQKLPVGDDEINLVAKFFAPGRGGDFIVSCTSGQKTKQKHCNLRTASTENFSRTTLT